MNTPDRRASAARRVADDVAATLNDADKRRGMRRFFDKPSAQRDQLLDAYEKALSLHRWTETDKTTLLERAYLSNWRGRLDIDAALWNAAAPADHQVKAADHG